MRVVGAGNNYFTVMSIISYAQNLEDVILWRALKHVDQGFYVDVGANDPEIDSVTKAFYDKGWCGINIEPVTQWFARLQAQRPRDINLQIAVGAYEGRATLYDMPDTGLSTMDRDTAVRHRDERGYEMREISVRVDTLSSVCEKYHLAPIHFMKIDVEGAEKSVLEGLDLVAIRPWIMLIESTMPNSQIEIHHEWEHLITDRGYEFAYFDGLNRYYVAKERAYLKAAFHAPPNVFDGYKPLAQHALEEKLERQRIHAQTMALQAEEQRACQVAALGAELAKAQQDMASLEASLKGAQKQLQESLNTAHHWWQQATALEKERDDLRQSWSWRMTAPVRWLAVPLVVSKVPRQSNAGAAARPLRNPLSSLMGGVLRHPRMSYRINQWLLRYLPSVQRRLAEMARADGLMPGSAEYMLRRQAFIGGECGVQDESANEKKYYLSYQTPGQDWLMDADEALRNIRGEFEGFKIEDEEK